MLSLVPLRAPQIVVPVLAAAGRIGANGLDVAPRVSADPYVLPGRRDHQGLDPGQRPPVVDGRGVGPQIREAAPAAPAQDSRAVGVTTQRPGRHWRLPSFTPEVLCLPGRPSLKLRRDRP